MVAKGRHGRPRPAVAAVGVRLRGATGGLPAPAGERGRGGAARHRPARGARLSSRPPASRGEWARIPTLPALN